MLPGDQVGRKHKCPMFFKGKDARNGSAFIRFKLILMRTSIKLGCRRSSRGGDYFIKHQRVPLSMRGSLCSAYIMLIITLQPQYNAVGERKFWEKTQTKPKQPNKPALHYPPDKALGNLTSLSANHQTQLPVVKIENVMVCLSMEEREPGKALILQDLLSPWVRRNWWWFCCRRKQLWSPVPGPTLQGQGWPGDTQSRCAHAGKALQNTSDTRWVLWLQLWLHPLVHHCNEPTHLSWALGGTPVGIGAKHCTVLQGMAAKVYPWTSGTLTLSLKTVISRHRISYFGDVDMDKLQYGCVILDAKYLSKLESFLVALREEEAGEGDTKFPSWSKNRASQAEKWQNVQADPKFRADCGEHCSTLNAPVWVGWDMDSLSLSWTTGEGPCCQVNQQTAFPLRAALVFKAFSKPAKEVPRAQVYTVMTSCKRRIPLLTLYILEFQGLLTLSNQNPFSLQHSKTLNEIKITLLPNFLWVNYFSSCAKLNKKKE